MFQNYIQAVKRNFMNYILTLVVAGASTVLNPLQAYAQEQIQTTQKQCSIQGKLESLYKHVDKAIDDIHHMAKRVSSKESIEARIQNTRETTTQELNSVSVKDVQNCVLPEDKKYLEGILENFQYAHGLKNNKEFKGTFGAAFMEFDKKNEAKNWLFSGEGSAAGAEFSGYKSAAGAEFSGTVSAFMAEFSGEESGYKSEFSGSLSAFMAEFSGEESGYKGEFSGEMSGYKAIFSGKGSASRAKFSGNESASEAEFSGEESGYKAIFSGKRSASRAKFSEYESASEAKFSGEESGYKAIFSGIYSGKRAKFRLNSKDLKLKIKGKSVLKDAKFGVKDFLN